ncbi:hypothetical protein BGU78_18615, partial [Clostridioides difficile]
ALCDEWRELRRPPEGCVFRPDPGPLPPRTSAGAAGVVPGRNGGGGGSPDGWQDLPCAYGPLGALVPVCGSGVVASMSALMLQVGPPVQVRPDTWLQRFGIGPKTLRPPVAVAWSGAGQAIYQNLAVKVTREGEETPARKIATLYRG